MATPGAEFSTLRRKVPTSPRSLSSAEVDLETKLQELEKKIVDDRGHPISDLLREVVERTRSLTGADGAAIAICDQWGVTCRASVGQAPEMGSRLHPDSALTRECFETGQTVVCEDTETDYRVRRSTAKSLSLRSAVVVPLQTHSSVLGVIEVLASRPSAFSAMQIAGLQRIGERLADILHAEAVPAESDTPPTENVLAGVPAQPQEQRYEETVLAPLPTVAPPEKPKHALNTVILGVAVLLLLLPLLYFELVRTREARALSSRIASAVTPASTPESLSKPTAPKPGASPSPPPEAVATQPLASDPSSHPSLLARTSKAFPGLDSQPDVESAHAAVENQAAQVNRPPMPAVVIRGVLPGTQVFVDDQLIASTDPAGQASIAILANGVHHLRLRFNGYRDYEQSLDIQSGKTSTVTAKLESLELPALTERPKVPILEAAPAIPEPVTSSRLSPPNFALERTLKAHSGWVTTIAFSADGQRLASGSWDRTVKFWEVASGEQLSTLASKIKEVQSLAFSRDGHWLATENSSNTAVLRDPMTGREIRALPSEKPLGALGSNWVYSIAFSPDGRWLASGVDDKTVRLWDVTTGDKVRDFTGLRRPVIYIAFSPDGRRLATGDDEKNIRIWDTASGEALYKLSGHKKTVYAVGFSPNGRWLASASADKTVRLWDSATGREVHTFSGHGNVVTSIAFSPDGRWLVSGSWDKTIKIWDVETGREVQTLAGHDHPVYSVAFDSRGGWLASGSEDGAIKLWRLDTAAVR